MLTGGGYSEKFKQLSQERNDKLSKTEPLHAQQLAARERARKLSLDTNRRRRALELKKRLEAHKEAKRREEVLEERRKRQQEATQKFQRLKRGSPKTPSSAEKPYYNAPLQDGIQMAHGYRVESANGSGSQQGTPNLEDALRLVGAHNSHSAYGSYSSTAPAGYISGGSIYQQEYSQSDNSLHRKYGTDSNINVTSTSSKSSYHGYTTSATATSTSNHGLPVGQFQQDLQEQQRKFVEEEAKSLQEFNDAIMQETSPEEALERSDSLSSVDSLEEQPQRSSNSKTDKTDTRFSVSRPGGPAVTVNYYTQGHYNSPSVAKEHPQPKEVPGNVAANDSSQGRLFVSNQRTLVTEDGLGKYHQKLETNGELTVEETSETDIVSELVEDRKPKFLQGSSQHSKSNLPRTYADTVGGNYMARTSEAWVSQATPESTSSHSAHPVVLAAANSSLGSTASSTRNRQVPAKTSATVFTVVPNMNGSNISHQTQQVVSSPNRTKEGTGRRKEQRERLDETPTADRPPKAGGRKGVQQPVSILKKTNSEQPAKLGGFKIRNSLEISKSSSVGLKSEKKSVRWTDMEYEDNDKTDLEDSAKVLNGCKDAPAEDSNDNESSDTADAHQQNRTMSGGCAERDNRIASTNGTQKGSPKSKPSYHNSGYSSYSSKKPTESSPSVAVTSKPFSARNVHKNHTAGYKSSNTSSIKNGPTHGKNGLHLNKTPTDDEINWLWDKVRTCLNSRDEKEVDQVKVTERPPTGQQSRQVASVTNQYIDGGRITANLRPVSTHARTSSATAHGRSNGVPRWRTNSDSGSYLRRTALLQQRRQHSAINRAQGSGTGQPPPRQGSAHQQPVPASSHQGPSRTVTVPPPQSYDNEVSDSLLAFQRAEQLVNDNLSEAEIGAAIDNHRTPATQEKVPSALSMEEQRILESLDRLNERLRSVASDTSPYMAITPKPPPFYYKPRKAKPNFKDNKV